MTDKLTISQARLLSELLTACRISARVKWAVGGDSDRIVDGVARHIVDEHHNFINNDRDVRDGFVWISGTFEHFLPVRDVLDLMDRSLFYVTT